MEFGSHHADAGLGFKSQCGILRRFEGKLIVGWGGVCFGILLRTIGERGEGGREGAGD